MKTIYKILFLTLLLHTAGFSQIEVLGIVKPTTSVAPCDGSINLQFEVSELPYTLTVNGIPNTIEVTTTVYTLEDLCPGTITIYAVDNHGCDDTKEVELEECGDIFGSCSTTWQCYQSDHKLGINLFVGDEIYDYTWSNGQTTKDLIDVRPGVYSVEYVNKYGCKKLISNLELFYPFIESYLYPSSNVACDGSLTIKAPDFGSSNYRLNIYNENEEVVFHDDWNGGSIVADGLCDFGKFRIVVTDTKTWCNYTLYFIFNSDNCNLEVNLVDLQGTKRCYKTCLGPECQTGAFEVELVGDIIDPNRYDFFLFKGGSIESNIGQTKFNQLEARQYRLFVQDINNHNCNSELNVLIPACTSHKSITDCDDILLEENDFEIEKENAFYSNQNKGSIIVTFLHPSENKTFIVTLMSETGEIEGEIIKTNEENTVSYKYLSTGTYSLSVNNGCEITKKTYTIRHIPCPSGDCGGLYCPPCNNGGDSDCIPSCTYPEICKGIKCGRDLCSFNIDLTESAIDYEKTLYHDLSSGTKILIKELDIDGDLTVIIKQGLDELWVSDCLEEPNPIRYFELVSDSPVEITAKDECFTSGENHFKITLDCPHFCNGSECPFPEFCEEGLCGEDLCTFKTDINYDPKTHINFEKYLFHDLVEGDMVKFENLCLGTGLSLVFSQGENILYSCDCDAVSTCKNNFKIKQDGVPVLMEVFDFKLDGYACSNNNTSSFCITLGCGGNNIFENENVLGGKVIMDKEDMVRIYPNPFNTNISFISNNTKILTVSIFNAIGQLVKEKIFTSPKLKTDVEMKNKPNGIYYVKILLENGIIVTRKMIKAY